ncbi:unnamed protein product [Rotaria socialis]
MAEMNTWNESLFGCCDDFPICCFGCCCTPCLFGSNAEKIDDRQAGLFSPFFFFASISSHPMTATNNQSILQSFNIRPCTIADEESAIDVCLKTGDAGNDATLLYDDPKLLGYRFVSPYIHLSPELAFILEDLEGNVCGYVLGTLHSDIFYQQYVNEWLSKVKQLYPKVPSDEESVKQDREVLRSFHNDNLQSFKLFDDYPSHLHIDLLPKAQGQGYGTKMIHHIVDELKRLGSKGVHLQMSANNARAFRFYTKVGFTVLEQDPETIWFGKKLT